MEQYRIGELAEKAEVTKRTIHYYLSRGLLPPSGGAGVGSYYTDDHLYRILLIKKYQEGYLPLDEIRKKIIGLSLDEVKERLENSNEQNLMILETQENYSIGILYKKLNLGLGVELHYPMDNIKAEELTLKIFEFNNKLNREG